MPSEGSIVIATGFVLTATLPPTEAVGVPFAVLIAYARDHLLFGAGYGSFWGIGDASPMLAYGDTWLANVYEAHDGYLDLLVNIRTAAIESRVSVTVRGAPPPIQDVFALAGLDELFGIPGGRSRRTHATPSEEKPKRTALRLLPPLTTP